MNEFDQAYLAIHQARLGASTERQAVRLLRAAAQRGGHIKCSKAALGGLFDLSWGSVRRTLGTLQEKGIIHYSTNEWVYIDFRAWPAVASFDHPRAEIDHPRAEIDHPRAKIDHPRAEIDHPRAEAAEVETPIDHPRAEIDHPRAEIDHPRAKNGENGGATYTHAHAPNVCLFVDHSYTTMEEQTNKQTPATPNAPATPTGASNTVDAALAFGLLSAIGVIPNVAKRVAQDHSLADVQAAVGHWYMNRKELGGKFQDTPGIVIYWLDNWEATGIPPVSSQFKRTELYRRFRTAAEIAEEREQEAHWERLQGSVALSSAPSTTAFQAADSADLNEDWANAVRGLGPQFQWLVDEPLRRTVKEDTEMWVVGLLSPQGIRSLDWLNQRAAKTLSRSLTTLARRVQVVFQEGVDYAENSVGGRGS